MQHLIYAQKSKKKKWICEYIYVFASVHLHTCSRHSVWINTDGLSGNLDDTSVCVCMSVSVCVGGQARTEGWTLLETSCLTDTLDVWILM